MSEQDTEDTSSPNLEKDQETGGEKPVPIAWEALEDAFENNAPEVHSYLHLGTGEVIRVVDGIADPAMHARISADDKYLRIDPVSSREQYRWMERFIATVDEPAFRQKLVDSIDGKGAFRRFKDVLMNYPEERERWFVFRSERLRTCMEAWLQAHRVSAVKRAKVENGKSEVAAQASDDAPASVAEEHAEAGAPSERTVRRPGRATGADQQRNRLRDLVDLLPTRELDAALAFLEFLRERRHLPRAQARGNDSGRAEGASGKEGAPRGGE